MYVICLVFYAIGGVNFNFAGAKVVKETDISKKNVRIVTRKA